MQNSLPQVATLLVVKQAVPPARAGGQRIRLIVGSMLALLLGGSFTSCAPLAVVTHRHLGIRQELTAEKVSLLELAKPGVALGACLAEARAAEVIMKKDPENREVRKKYNFEVARVVGLLEKSLVKPWDRPMQVPGPDGPFTLSTKLRPGEDHHPANFRFIPADSLKIGGKYFGRRTVVDGVGAPLVAIANNETKGAGRDFAPRHIYAPVTAVLRFQGRKAEIEFLEPLLVDSTQLDGRTVPVAADLTAPMATYLADQKPERLGLVRLLIPEDYADTARLTRMQPYDQDRIPVVLIHGLRDTPASWVPMINTLWANPQIRRNYQFWVYSYPSGYPYPYSASLLRDELDKVNRTFPHHKPLVLIGHSMGALLARLMVTDAGERLWVECFGRPPESTDISGDSRAFLERSLIFRGRPHVGRVVFISAPHRGSLIATSWVGRIGSRLVRTPSFMLNLGSSVARLFTFDEAAAKLDHMPNSIDTLSPKNRFMLEVNKIPIQPGVPYHSIIGDRGRGDTPDSSDGVVPYWSSHLDGAASERIVPSNHGANRNPEGIAEVRRILLLHLNQKQ